MSGKLFVAWPDGRRVDFVPGERYIEVIPGGWRKEIVEKMLIHRLPGYMHDVDGDFADTLTLLFPGGVVTDTRDPQQEIDGAVY